MFKYSIKVFREKREVNYFAREIVRAKFRFTEVHLATL